MHENMLIFTREREESDLEVEHLNTTGDQGIMYMASWHHVYIQWSKPSAVSIDCVIWILPRKDKMEHSDCPILIRLR